MSEREAFRQRVSVYAVAVRRDAGTSSDDFVAARLHSRFGMHAASAWYRACATETPTRVVEWS